MKSTKQILCLTAVVVTTACSTASAGVWSKLWRESAEYFSQGAGRAAREAVEGATEQGAKRLVRPALREGVEQGAKRGASVAAQVLAQQSAKPLIARFGSRVVASVLVRHGDDGAKALEALTPRGARQLAAMSDELARSRYAKDWLKLVADRGDQVTAWLWKRRGGVAVGTVATVAVLKPADFLKASSDVGVAALDNASEHVAAPLAQRAAEAFPWTLFFAGAGVAFACAYLIRRFRKQVTSV